LSEQANARQAELREHSSATLKNDDITTPPGSRSGLDGVFLFRNVKTYVADTNPLGRQHEKAASCGVLKHTLVVHGNATTNVIFLFTKNIAVFL
jgi:hypothetical protein